MNGPRKTSQAAPTSDAERSIQASVLQASAAALLGQLASMAMSLQQVLKDANSNDTTELLPAAISACAHLGWMADHGATLFGGRGASVEGGDPRAWFLPPVFLRDLGAIEAGTRKDGAP